MWLFGFDKKILFQFFWQKINFCSVNEKKIRFCGFSEKTWFWGREGGVRFKCYFSVLAKKKRIFARKLWFFEFCDLAENVIMQFSTKINKYDFTVFVG